MEVLHVPRLLRCDCTSLLGNYYFIATLQEPIPSFHHFLVFLSVDTTAAHPRVVVHHLYLLPTTLGDLNSDSDSSLHCALRSSSNSSFIIQPLAQFLQINTTPSPNTGSP